MGHFEKKLQHEKRDLTRFFQRDFVNIFGKTNFTSVCFVMFRRQRFDICNGKC